MEAKKFKGIIEFKGTKGTWESRGSRIFLKGSNKSICDVHIHNFSVPKKGEVIQQVEMEANRDLIEKSFEMFETLKYLVEAWDFINDKGYHNPDIEKARDLLLEITKNNKL